MKWLAISVFLASLLPLAGLLLNRPPLLSPPGPLKRLITYLTTNVAEMHPDHAFPELRPRFIPSDADRLRIAVLESMESLGWEEIRESENRIEAIVSTPLLRFRDDIDVRLEEVDGGVLLHARSSSRVGKGDLAANARHIRELIAEIERRAIALEH